MGVSGPQTEYSYLSRCPIAISTVTIKFLNLCAQVPIDGSCKLRGPQSGGKLRPLLWRSFLPAGSLMHRSFSSGHREREIPPLSPIYGAPPSNCPEPRSSVSLPAYCYDSERFYSSTGARVLLFAAEYHQLPY